MDQCMRLQESLIEEAPQLKSSTIQSPIPISKPAPRIVESKVPGGLGDVRISAAPIPHAAVPVPAAPLTKLVFPVENSSPLLSTANNVESNSKPSIGGSKSSPPPVPIVALPINPYLAILARN